MIMRYVFQVPIFAGVVDSLTFERSAFTGEAFETCQAPNGQSQTDATGGAPTTASTTSIDVSRPLRMHLCTPLAKS